MCQGFSHLQVFLHHFVMVKLATTSIRVNISMLVNPVWEGEKGGRVDGGGGVLTAR